MGDRVRRINMWSSPRNLSTALMYSWRERADTTVVDEPLYAHYLHQTGRDHPGAAEVLASQSPDGASVIREVMFGSYDSEVVFFKQMAKHLVGLDHRVVLDGFDTVLLTRDPWEMLTSLQKNLPDATIDDTGFVELVALADAVVAGGGRPTVIDAKLLLTDPRGVLSELCERLSLRFDDAMLSWPAGPKPEDGVWAPYWYDGVHRSTGWDPWRAKDDVLAPSLAPVLDEAEAMYRRLLPFRIG